MYVSVCVFEAREESPGTAAGDGARCGHAEMYNSSLQTKRGCEDKMSSLGTAQGNVLPRGKRVGPEWPGVGSSQGWNFSRVGTSSSEPVTTSGWGGARLCCAFVDSGHVPWAPFRSMDRSGWAVRLGFYRVNL